MKTVLFDLDGTLSNPKVGIIGSIQYALAKLSDKVFSDDELLWCIGPPLQESFAKLLKTGDPQRIDMAMRYYRELFAEKGLFQNELYAGIDELLGQLVELDCMLFVATSKPHVFATKIIDYFELSHYFRTVYGSELDGTRSDKGELIGHILASEGLEASSTLMVGDRKHDIIGAQKQAVGTIGVTWGFGGRTELLACGADHVVDTPQDLLAVVNRLPHC